MAPWGLQGYLYFSGPVLRLFMPGAMLSWLKIAPLLTVFNILIRMNLPLFCNIGKYLHTSVGHYLKVYKREEEKWRNVKGERLRLKENG
jgi:hypothetical protein